MSLSPDISGLRRRSPNPDSPHLTAPDGSRTTQPYSPSLLSPYATAEAAQRLPSRYSPWRRSTASTINSAYTPYGGATPTIRLVPSYTDSDAAPTPITLISRSRSNDIDDRPLRGHLSSPSLRRHETEPSYPKLERSGGVEEPYLFSRDPKDRPVPPLPLSIRRKSTSEGSVASSIESTLTSKSDDSAGATSVDAISAGTGRKTWKSLLLNPFRESQFRQSGSRSLGSFRHLNNLGSRAMSRLSRSSASDDTLVGDARSIADEKHVALGLERTSSEDTLNGDTMKRIRSTEGGAKIAAKIPERQMEKVKQGWTSFKIVLLLSVLTLFGYGLAGLCWSMQIMLRILPNSDVTMVTDPDVVIFLLLFSLLALFTSFVGLAGTLLSSRSILSFYCLLLWPTFISLALVGYSSFKRANVQLDRKLNQVWSQFLSEEDRLRIQNGLGCCGYYNPFHDATYSKRCYPRTPLAGCKARWTVFEEKALRSFARAAFSTVPIHLINIVISLICSNHVDNRFGQGLTPVKYRIQAADVRANAMAILASLPVPAEPKPSRPTSMPLKRRSAMRSSRSVRSSTSTVRLVDPYHPRKERQYSTEEMITRDGDQCSATPFADRQTPALHRRSTGDLGLPTPPTSRLSSLNYGSSERDSPRRDADKEEYKRDKRGKT